MSAPVSSSSSSSSSGINTTLTEGSAKLILYKKNIYPDFRTDYSNKKFPPNPLFSEEKADHFLKNPDQLKVDDSDKTVFENSNANVAFVGAVDLKNNKIYLLPLEPWQGHYETHAYGKPLDGTKIPPLDEAHTPITHGGIDYKRDKNGFIKDKDGKLVKDVDGLRMPSHFWISYRKGLTAIFEPAPDTLGFAVIKEDNTDKEKRHVFSSQSLHLHENAFDHPTSQNSERKDCYLPKKWMQCIMRALAFSMPTQIHYDQVASFPS